jgi:hypothetical protein
MKVPYTSSYHKMSFQSLGPDNFIICTQSDHFQAPVSPRKRQAQLTLQPLRTRDVPVDFTPTTPKYMRFKEIERSHKYAGFGNMWHGKLHRFLVGWMCGV